MTEISGESYLFTVFSKRNTIPSLARAYPVTQIVFSIQSHKGIYKTD